MLWFHSYCAATWNEWNADLSAGGFDRYIHLVFFSSVLCVLSLLKAQSNSFMCVLWVMWTSFLNISSWFYNPIVFTAAILGSVNVLRYLLFITWYTLRCDNDSYDTVRNELSYLSMMKIKIFLLHAVTSVHHMTNTVFLKINQSRFLTVETM